MRFTIDAPGDELADVIDLAEARRRREQPDEEPEERHTYARAKGPGWIDLWINIRGHELPDLVAPVEFAERFGRLLLRAAADARRMNFPQCRFCEKHACMSWHVGERYRGWHKGRRVHAVLERICKRSVRLRDLDTGDRFYAGSRYSWQPVNGPA